MYIERAQQALEISRRSTCDLLGLSADRDEAFWSALQDAAHIDAQVLMDQAWDCGEVGPLGQMRFFNGEGT